MGAGITGLTAADALVAAGASVTVLEARERLGGRALSIPVAEGTVDLGPSWFWPDEPLTHALVGDLGLRAFPQHIEGDALFEADARGPQRIDGNPIDMPAYRLADGVQALAERLAHRIGPNSVMLGEPVSAITVMDDGVEVHARSATARATQVVVALPPALAVEQIAFAPDLPTDLRAAAQGTAVWMGAMVKAVAVYDEAFWRSESLAGSAISYAGPFREFHDHSGPHGMPAAIFGFAPAEQFPSATPDGIAAEFVHHLARLFGPAAAQPTQVHALDWSREGRTMPRVPLWAGPMSGFGAPIFQAPVAGRIHLASTETATAYAGHIEGAVRAGSDVARRVRALLASGRG